MYEMKSKGGLKALNKEGTRPQGLGLICDDGHLDTHWKRYTSVGRQYKLYV